MVKTKVRNTQNYLYGKWINTISKRPSKGKVSHLSKRYDAHQETPGMQILKAYSFCSCSAAFPGVEERGLAIN